MILTIASQKGGVGKTTLAAHFVWWALENGFRTLAVDFDTQGNLSTTLQTDLSILARPGGSVSLFTAATPADLDLTHIGPKLDLLHGNQDSDNSDRIPVAEAVANLKRLLPHLKSQYDVVLFDTGPSTSVRQIAPLTISDVALIPTTPEAYSVQGLGLTLNAVNIAKGPNPGLQPWAVVNRALRRKRHMATIAEIQTYLTPLQPILYDREAVSAAIDDRRPVWRHPAAKKDVREAWQQLMRNIASLGGLTSGDRP